MLNSQVLISTSKKLKPFHKKTSKKLKGSPCQLNGASKTYYAKKCASFLFKITKTRVIQIN